MVLEGRVRIFGGGKGAGGRPKRYSYLSLVAARVGRQVMMLSVDGHPLMTLFPDEKQDDVRDSRNESLSWSAACPICRSYLTTPTLVVLVFVRRRLAYAQFGRIRPPDGLVFRYPTYDLCKLDVLARVLLSLSGHTMGESFPRILHSTVILLYDGSTTGVYDESSVAKASCWTGRGPRLPTMWHMSPNDEVQDFLDHLGVCNWSKSCIALDWDGTHRIRIVG